MKALFALACKTVVIVVTVIATLFAISAVATLVLGEQTVEHIQEQQTNNPQFTTHKS